MRIKREKAVAVAIDYQERLLPAMNDKDNLLKNSAKLLEGLKILGVPIYFTQQYTKGLGQTDERMRQAAGKEEYLEKIRFSGYREIAPKLEGPQVQPYVILCGIESHVCVLQTAMEFKEQGYVPVLVTDCVTSRKARDYEMALERAKQEQILLTTCEALLFELLEEAGTQTSKMIQKLVK